MQTIAAVSVLNDFYLKVTDLKPKLIAFLISVSVKSPSGPIIINTLLLLL